jgi:RNA polymerase sigma-70 factor (ECF subfamily)
MEPDRPAGPAPEAAGSTGDPPHPGEAAAPYTSDMRQPFADASDAAIVVAVGRFHEDALAEAYRRHAGAVFGLATRVLSDGTAAEEVVQEVFLRLWNNPERFDPERGSLRSYLLAQTHGRSVDLLRSNQSRRAREEREARAAATAGYDLEHEVWDLAVAERVRKAVTSLPLDERRAIELAYFGGHTYREVATALGAPEGTVKSRIRMGLKRMRAVLSDTAVGVVGLDR